MRRLRIAKVGCGQSQPFFDLLFESVLECIGMFLQPHAIGIGAVPCTKHAKGDLGGREVRLRLFDDASQRLECLAMSIDDRADSRVEGNASKILEPRDTDAFEVAVQRTAESFSGFVY